MAEVAGLVLSGVAVTSLITSCVEIVQFIEDGRDCMFDFSLAMTKLDLLQIRLCQLGEAMASCPQASPDGVVTEDSYPSQRPRGYQQSSLGDALLGIQDILGRTGNLCRKYSFDFQDGPIKPEYGLATSIQEVFGPTTAAGVQHQRRQPLRWSSLSRRVSWAVQDKRKLGGLVSEFDFFLSNLEKITQNLAAQRSLIAHPASPAISEAPTLISQSGQLESLVVNAGRDIVMNDTRDHDNAASTSGSGGNVGKKRQPLSTRGPAKQGQTPMASTSQHSNSQTHTIYEKCEQQDQSMSILGDLKQTTSTSDIPAHYKGNISKDQAFAYLGRTDEHTVLSLARMHQENLEKTLMMKGAQKVSVVVSPASQ